MAIGERLEEVRRRRGVSQKKLAADLGMKPQTLNKILTGKVKQPGFDTVAKIAVLLGVTLDEVLRAERDAAWRELSIVEDLDATKRELFAQSDADAFRRAGHPKLDSVTEIYDQDAHAAAVAQSEGWAERERRIIERRFLDKNDPRAARDERNFMPFEVPPEEFIEGDWDYMQTWRGGETALLGGAAAGDFADIDVTGETAEVLNPTLRDVQSGRYGVVRVKGRSMEPRLHDGDLVLIDTFDKVAGPKRIMAVYERGFGSAFGYVHRVGELTILAKANSAEFKPIVLSDNAMIRGVVKKRLEEALE